MMSSIHLDLTRMVLEVLKAHQAQERNLASYLRRKSTPNLAKRRYSIIRTRATLGSFTETLPKLKRIYTGTSSKATTRSIRCLDDRPSGSREACQISTLIWALTDSWKFFWEKDCHRYLGMRSIEIKKEFSTAKAQTGNREHKKRHKSQAWIKLRFNNSFRQSTCLRSIRIESSFTRSGSAAKKSQQGVKTWLTLMAEDVSHLKSSPVCSNYSSYSSRKEFKVVKHRCKIDFQLRISLCCPKEGTISFTESKTSTSMFQLVANIS